MASSVRAPPRRLHEYLADVHERLDKAVAWKAQLAATEKQVHRHRERVAALIKANEALVQSKEAMVAELERVTTQSAEDTVRRHRVNTTLGVAVTLLARSSTRVPTSADDPVLGLLHPPVNRMRDMLAARIGPCAPWPDPPHTWRFVRFVCMSAMLPWDLYWVPPATAECIVDAIMDGADKAELCVWKVICRTHKPMSTDRCTLARKPLMLASCVDQRAATNAVSLRRTLMAKITQGENWWTARVRLSVMPTVPERFRLEQEGAYVFAEEGRLELGFLHMSNAFETEVSWSGSALPPVPDLEASWAEECSAHEDLVDAVGEIQYPAFPRVPASIDVGEAERIIPSVMWDRVRLRMARRDMARTIPRTSVGSSQDVRRAAVLLNTLLDRPSEDVDPCMDETSWPLSVLCSSVASGLEYDAPIVVHRIASALHVRARVSMDRMRWRTRWTEDTVAPDHPSLEHGGAVVRLWGVTISVRVQVAKHLACLRVADRVFALDVGRVAMSLANTIRVTAARRFHMVMPIAAMDIGTAALRTVWRDDCLREPVERLFAAALT